MIVHDTHIRVRYGETDQMGYVYYGKYAEYFEVGRAEMVRHLGIPYKHVEEKGILMPVAELQIHYRRPALYDDLLRVRTCVPELPSAGFLTTYEVFNEQEALLVSGKVRLAFVSKARMAPVRVPDFVLDAVLQHWAEP